MERVELVARGGVEPPTYRFSGGRSYQLSYLAGQSAVLVTARLRDAWMIRGSDSVGAW